MKWMDKKIKRPLLRDSLRGSEGQLMRKKKKKKKIYRMVRYNFTKP